MVNTLSRQDKIEYIQSFSDNKILDFLDELSNSKLKDKYREVLDKFVPINLRHEKQNAIKYGGKTKERFIVALKGSLKKGESNLIKTSQRAIFYLFELWFNSNPEFCQQEIHEFFKSQKDIKPEELYSNIINFLIELNEQEKVTKETIQKFYDFSPIQPNEKLLLKIRSCKSASSIFTKKEIENEVLRDKLKEIKEENEELKTANNEIKLKLSSLEKYSKADFIKTKESLENKIKQNDSEIKNLNEQIEELKSLEQKYEKLYSENLSLKNIKKINLKELNSKLEDKEYKNTLLDMILDDSDAGRLIIKKLNLKEELMKNCQDYLDDELIATNLELQKLKSEKEELKQDILKLKDEADEIENNNLLSQIEDLRKRTESKSYFEDKFEDARTPLYIVNEQQFINNFLESTNISDGEAIKIHEQIKNNTFTIIEDKEIIRQWHKACNTNIPILDVIPEFDWTSYKDWFGDFLVDTFSPSTTLISDYYCFLKNNADKFGIIVFDDFNKIAPEIYLEPFIKALEINGFMNIVHPYTEVQTQHRNLKSIYKLNNLKYVFIKSQDSDAFDIPKSLEKFEVKI